MLLDSIFGRPRANYTRTVQLDDAEYWRDHPWGRKVHSGVVVDENTAHNVAALWCATRVIAETTAGLPLIEYVRQGEDRKRATDDPLYDLLIQPNPEMGGMVFREGRTSNQFLLGNGFAEIERMEQNDPESEPIALWPIHAGRVRAVTKHDHADGKRLVDLGYRYMVRNDDGAPPTPLKPHEVLHVPGVLSDDGYWGKGIVTYARETIGISIATERHGAVSFGEGNIPKVFLKNVTGMENKEKRDQFRKNWKEKHSDPSEVGILPPGAEITALGINNDDMQFLQTRRFNKNEWATWARLPPHTIGDLERSTFSNIEVQGVELVIYGLYPWAKRWEEQIQLKLMSREKRRTHYVEHLWQSLLRGDTTTRFEAYVKAIMNGFMTINEVRKLENLNGIGPAGDMHYVPLNMTTAERMFQDSNPNRTVAAVPAQPPPALPAPPANESAMADALGKVATALAAQPEPAPKPNGELHAAARAVLLDALRRMGTREANSCRGVVQKKGDFDAWLADFWPRHEDILASNLAPACRLLVCCGHSEPAADLAARLCKEAREELVAGYNTLNREQFAALLDRWPNERAAETARKILESPPCPA